MFIPYPRKGEAASDPATSMFRFWISFWPVAPFFGVKWRFEDMMVPMNGNLAARPADLARAGTEVQARAAKAAAEAPAVAEPAAERAAETGRTSLEAVEDVAEIGADAAETPATPKAPETSETPETPAKKPRGLKAKAPAEPDDLKLIKGIGPSLERQLNGLGIYSFEQLAGFDDEALRWIDENIETATFKGRCWRDDWVGQAKAQRG